MIASLNQAIKANRKSCTVPINLISYHILCKFRDAGIIYGFSLEGQKPKAKVFLNVLPKYFRLKVYPLTASNYISVRKQPFFRYRSYLQNTHGRNRHLLLTTNKGLKWDFELLHDGLGGKLLVSVIRRM